MRPGLYRRHWGGSMDEGWTRFLLEQFAIPFAALTDAEILKGGTPVTLGKAGGLAVARFRCREL